MKKIIAILLLAVFAWETAVPDAGAAARKKVSPGSIAGLVREYALYEGFDVVSVGSLGLGLVRLIGRRTAETEEEKAVFDLMEELRTIAHTYPRKRSGAVKFANGTLAFE